MTVRLTASDLRTGSRRAAASLKASTTGDDDGQRQHRQPEEPDGVGDERGDGVRERELDALVVHSPLGEPRDAERRCAGKREQPEHQRSSAAALLLVLPEEPHAEDGEPMPRRPTASAPEVADSGSAMAIASAATVISSSTVSATMGTATTHERKPSRWKSRCDFQLPSYAVCGSNPISSSSRSAVRPSDGSARKRPKNAARNELAAAGKRLRSAHQNSKMSTSVPAWAVSNRSTGCSVSSGPRYHSACCTGSS